MEMKGAKNELQMFLNELYAPLESQFTAGRAGIDMGATGSIYNEATALMEAFARPLWGLVPHASGGGESALWPMFLEGIINGTDPEHEEYWGEFSTKDQRMVEQAVLGLGLALAPHKMWGPLSDTQKRHVYNWLNQINHVDRSNPNNWLMFTVLVNVGFKKIGLPYDQEIMNDYLEKIDTYYLGDGWYSDGLTDQRDYYIAFAMHYYTLIYAKLMADDDPQRAAAYRERSAQFAQDFIYWFAEDGSAIPFGRSLTYRFAQVSFWSALVYAEVLPFSYGVLKGIIMRHFRWWFDKPIIGIDGLLSIGYAYPNLVMTENYNAPGSPYWAFKAMLILALPDDHPFWQAEEEPLPVLNDLLPLQEARMLVSRPEGNRHVIAYTSGQMANFDMAHSAAKYSKFAYSTLFGFSVPKSGYGLSQGAYDSTLALCECDEHYRVRRFCEQWEIGESFVYSLWHPWSDVHVETWIIPAGLWHVRIHSIHSARKLDVAEGGFAIGQSAGFSRSERETIQVSNTAVSVQLPWGISAIHTLSGFDRGECVQPEPNTNLLKPRTLLPSLCSRLEPRNQVLISAIFGATNTPENQLSLATPPLIKQSDGSIAVYDPRNGALLHTVDLSERRNKDVENGN